MVITSIVQSLLPSYLPRWGLRSMWELAAVLNFHHVPGFGNDLSSGKDDPTVGHPLYCEIRQVERHDAKLSERMFTHVPILIEKIVPYRDHLNSTDIR
ncbi:atp-dependent rna helicase [Musa troglodytarum]|uniref:Atp-dependent rna helicase n=1 Tax=Musa troglodytarum TaxID=320322 RepID=A0A9E7G8G7_9LILI|nr:atp-dependent rna helicase [Musa troglodytarum]